MTDLISTRITADHLRGALEVEVTDRGVHPHRLPAWARRQLGDPQLLMAESQPSGVRLAFRTTATHVELEALPTKRTYPGAPPRPDGVYELQIDGRPHDSGSIVAGDEVVIDMVAGTAETHPGEPGTLAFADLPLGAKEVVIWLPHDETVELVSVRTDARVESPLPSARRTWLHHGSSISQGSNAAEPTGTWPVVAATSAGVDLVNLGLGGSALLDPAVARVVRDTPADLISLKLGINLVNTDLMRRRALVAGVHGFLDTIRDGHPETPLLVVSPVLCPMHEETPGPSAFDPESMADGRLAFRAAGDPAEVALGKLTLQVVREVLAAVVEERSIADPHLSYLDGRRLYGESDVAALPLPDRLHPDPETHRLMGRRFADLAFGGEGAFSDR
ncbi:MAG: lipase [Nocardioides sp.]|uniref:SGNH/GDSL hydrolase family protein n=1 Tax=Nocardioides sp. TaxID=35761 RepID=UPI0023865A01|nr:SGNH/GDSL hydrolase family protein [Nocardioides sp.]MDE0777185.1 lipase [Nocardioides sp.]